MDKRTVKELIAGLQEQYIQEIGRMVRNTAKEQKLMLVDQFIKAYGIMMYLHRQKMFLIMRKRLLITLLIFKKKR